MDASRAEHHNQTQNRKRRAACDQCHSAKVKCLGGGQIPCERCAASSLSCHYSFAARMGKPPGIKNRKTLETMRTNGNNSGSGSASLNHTPQQSQELSSASTARLSSTTRRGGSSSVTSPTTMESDLSMVDVDSFMRHDFPGTASDLGFDMPTSLEQSLDYQSPLATGTTDAWSVSFHYPTS